MPPPTPELLLVTCTHPLEGAEALARALVEARLAACVQVSAGLRSIYRWKGEVETADEVRLDIKTTTDRLESLVAEIGRRHPYELPEILASPVAWGHEAYLDWVRQQVSA